MARENQVVLLLVTIVLASIFGMSFGATYTVGDNTGWTIPSSSSFYPNWASGKTFKVGDTLVFKFPAGIHTVAQASKKNFDSCNTANTIGAILTTSPANITLNSAGTHYFICTIPTHCNSNQKLSITVAASSATTPASSPTHSGGATTPAASPAAPTSGATPPSGSTTAPATTPTSGSTSPSGSTTTPASEGPSTTSAPPPSFATSTSVGLLSLVAVGVAALMF